MTESETKDVGRGKYITLATRNYLLTLLPTVLTCNDNYLLVARPIFLLTHTCAHISLPSWEIFYIYLYKPRCVDVPVYTPICTCIDLPSKTYRYTVYISWYTQYTYKLLIHELITNYLPRNSLHTYPYSNLFTYTFAAFYTGVLTCTRLSYTLAYNTEFETEEIGNLVNIMIAWEPWDFYVLTRVGQRLSRFLGWFCCLYLKWTKNWSKNFTTLIFVPVKAEMLLFPNPMSGGPRGDLGSVNFSLKSFSKLDFLSPKS